MVYSRCCVAFFVGACLFAARFCALATWVQRSRTVRFLSARAPQVARGNCLRVATLCPCCEQDEARKREKAVGAAQCGLRSNRFSLRWSVARLTPSALAAADTLPSAR